MQDHGLAHLRQDVVIDPFVVSRGACHLHQGATGHDDETSAQGLDGFDLFIVGADHIVERLDLGQLEMVGSAATGHPGARNGSRCLQRAPDQLARGGPIEPHAALCGVHGLGHTQAQRPQVMAVLQGGVPVHGRL